MSKEKSAPKSKGKEDTTAVNLDTLPFALQRLDKLIGGAASGTVTFSPLKSKTLISIQNQGAVAEATLPKALDGLEGAWDFPFASLSAAVANRNSAQLAFSGGQLDIKDKRYTANLQGIESQSVVRVEKPENPTCEVEVDPKLWSLLNEMTSKVKINKSLAAMPDITVHYLFGKKTALAVAFDRFQMAACFAPNKHDKTFSLTLPLAKAEAIFKSSGVTALQANESLVYMKAGSSAFSTALPSVEDTTGVPTDAVLGRVKALKDAKFPKSVSLPKEDLIKFLENAKAVSAANALLQFKVDTSATKLTLSVEGNSISASIPSKAKKAFDFKLDINYVNTIVGKAGESIELEIDEGTLVFRTDEVIYASVLSVDDEETSTKKKKKSEESDDE